MGRKKFEIDVWLEQGDKLLDIGKDVAKKYSEHHEAICSIRSMLVKLVSACRKNDNLKAEEIKDELNAVSENIDKDVWKIWTTRIRAKKNAENKYSFRVTGPQFDYLQSYASENNVEVKGLINNLSSEYFLFNKVDKEYLDSFSELSPRDKKIFMALFKEFLDALFYGNNPNFAKKLHEARGGEINSKYRYVFKPREEFSASVKGVREDKVREGANGDLEYIVAPLPRRVRMYLILLSERYSIDK